MRRKNRQERLHGMALVEAAIILQLLILITMAALEYGWMFMNVQRITNAARHGARVAAAAGASLAEGQTSMQNLLTDLPATCTLGMDGSLVVATVSVPSSDVRLIHWDLLPMPATLQAVVKMAKEAG